MDRKRPVLGGSVRFPQYLGWSWTGCGPRLPIFGAKNWTEPDLRTLITPQNKSFTFVDGLAPKKPCLSEKNTCQFTLQEIQNIQQDCKAQQLMQAREKEELVAKKKEELDVEQLRVVWQSIQGAGFQSLHDYLHTLFNTRDPSFLLKSPGCSCIMNLNSLTLFMHAIQIWPSVGL